MNVGFIGLGNMGAAIAGSLLEAGHHLSVYNRTPARAGPLAERGAVVAGSPAEVARGAQALCTMLADDAAVEATLVAGGALWALPRGAVHVSLSTVSVEQSRRLAALHRDAGHHYVAAPVFGRPDAAAARTLWVLAAGSDAAIALARPLLQAIGQEVLVLGEEPEAATVVKIAGNFVLAALLETLGEAFALVRKHGVGAERFLDIINGKVLRSPIYANYGALIAAGRFEPAGFKLRHGLKDMRLVLEAGETAAVPLPLASLAHDHFLTALAWGWGDLDWAALARVAAVHAGLEPVRPPGAGMEEAW